MELQRLFRIEDFSGNNTFKLMDESPLIEAKNNSDALKKYLKKHNMNVKVKCSADNNVQFGITPMVKYNGQILIDGRKRMSWYKIVN